jgi:hypothetical protein
LNYNFSFILGIFTRESYSTEQYTHIILKADSTPSLRVLLKVVVIPSYTTILCAIFDCNKYLKIMRKVYFTMFILDFRYKIEIQFFFTEGLFPYLALLIYTHLTLKEFLGVYFDKVL